MDKLRIPRIALPCVALPGHKSDAMPSAIRSSLVCWYSPKRQGCTNENMAQTPVLRDLSGRGLHMTCHNFAWTTQSGIAEDGSMIFDGVDDVCDIYSDVIVPHLASDFTVVIRYMNFVSPDRSAVLSNASEPNRGAFIFNLDEDWFLESLIYIYGNPNSIRKTPVNEWVTNYFTPHDYNGQQTLTRHDATGKSTSMLALGAIRRDDQSNRFLNGLVSSCLVFNRTLTPEEIEWVKLNMID